MQWWTLQNKRYEIDATVVFYGSISIQQSCSHCIYICRILNHFPYVQYTSHTLREFVPEVWPSTFVAVYRLLAISGHDKNHSVIYYRSGTLIRIKFFVNFTADATNNHATDAGWFCFRPNNMFIRRRLGCRCCLGFRKVSIDAHVLDAILTASILNDCNWRLIVRLHDDHSCWFTRRRRRHVAYYWTERVTQQAVLHCFAWLCYSRYTKRPFRANIAIV